MVIWWARQLDRAENFFLVSTNPRFICIQKSVMVCTIFYSSILVFLSPLFDLNQNNLMDQPLRHHTMRLQKKKASHNELTAPFISRLILQIIGAGFTYAIVLDYFVWHVKLFQLCIPKFFYCFHSFHDKDSMFFSMLEKSIISFFTWMIKYA